MAPIHTLSWSILLFATGLFADSVILEEYSKSNAITSCKEGLIAGVDKYSLTAKITAEEETFRTRSLFAVHLLPKGFNWSRIFCGMYFAKVCDKEKPYVNCYCNGYSNGVFEIVINKTAETIESEGVIFFRWADVWTKNWTYSNMVSMPVVYLEAIEILIAGNKHVQHRANCRLSLSVGDIIDWCVTHLVGPTLSIELPPEIVTRKSKCARAIVTPKTPSRGYFNVSYQEQGGCMRSAVYTCHYERYNFIRPAMSTNGCQTLLMSFGWISFIMIGFHLWNKKRMSPI